MGFCRRLEMGITVSTSIMTLADTLKPASIVIATPRFTQVWVFDRTLPVDLQMETLNEHP